MEDFTITSILTRKEYRSFTLASLYKAPFIIGITILGVLIITIVLLQVLSIIHIYEDIPWLAFLLGIAILLLPLNYTRNMVQRTFPNSSMTKIVDFKFGGAGINAKDAKFEGFFRWSGIIKCDETKDFLVLVPTSKCAFFVKKDLLSPQQFEFIQSNILKT